MRKHSHSKKLILSTLCAVTLMSPSAFAANLHHAMRERGTIQSVDAKDRQLTVKDANGAMQVFTWKADTKFLEQEHVFHRAKAATPADLKEGEKAIIRYQKDRDHLVATKILVTSVSHTASKTAQ